MRKYILASLAVVPLLFSFSHAAQNSSGQNWTGQNWSGNDQSQSFVFSSDDGGSSSYLGVDIADITPERLSALKLKEEKGVEVTMVDQDAPAGKAGIKEHDVILSMNGTPVESVAQLRRMIRETPAGRVVSFGISRDGQPMNIKLQLAERDKWSPISRAKDFPVVIPDIDVHVPEIDIPSINMVVVTQSARSGLMVENITPQLGEFFGVKNGNGVLVRSVEKGSRADKAGFRAGDVIVKINDQPIHDTSDFTHAVTSRNRNAINVGVMRDRREQNLTLTLPEHKESGDLFEESLDNERQLNAQSQLELSKLQDQLAQLRPELFLAEQQASEYSRKAMEEARKALCQAQKDRDRATGQMREEMRKQQDQMKKQLEKMRSEFHWNQLDI
ncbi:MAG TPA: PDZ domain-containing protein [Verrucomicrobiae bacterium]|nr:PDZ domain-containing protein [Verrucomicrobiae bacterium]